MFRPQIPVHSRSYNLSVARSTVFVQQDDGTMLERYKEDVKLPPVENFKLSAQLKAGVNLEEVNTKILGSSQIDLDSLVKPTETKPTETKPTETKLTETKPTETKPTENV